MGSIWGRQDPGGPHVGPMNVVIWDIVHINFTCAGTINCNCPSAHEAILKNIYKIICSVIYPLNKVNTKDVFLYDEHQFVLEVTEKFLSS